MFSLKIFLRTLMILFLVELKPLSADDFKDIRLLVTSDLHGWLSTGLIYPRRKSTGLLYLADIIEAARKKNPDLILLDGGDLLQGSPLAHYYNHFSRRPAEENPFFRLFLSLKYDAVAVGNHDLAVNPLLEQEYAPNNNFSWLAANVYRRGKLVFKPFKILPKAGIKIAVIGFTTPGAMMWVGEKQLKEIKIRDADKSATEWLPLIKRRIKADLIIGLFHVGLSPFRDDENSKLSGIPPASNAYSAIKKHTEFDLAIIGHDHRLFPRRSGGPLTYINKTPVVGGGSWGEALIDLKLRLTKINGRWKIKKIETNIRKKNFRAKVNKQYSPPQEYKKYLFAELPWKISKTYNQKAGKCLNILNAMAQNEPQIIGTMLPEIRIRNIKNNFGKRIRRSDLFRWFKYDNKPVTIKVSERDIFLLKHPLPKFGSKKIPYNRKLFSRFKIKLDDKENPIPSPQKFLRQYKIKISEYHFLGGGGVTPGLFLKRDDLVERSDVYLRDRLFEFLKTSKPSLPPACDFLKYDAL